MKAKIGTPLEVKFLNFTASALRYIADRTFPLSVPTLMWNDAVIDSFEHVKEKMADAFWFFNRYEGLTSSIDYALAQFPERSVVLEFGVFRADMINYQARKFPKLKFVGFDSFEGLRESWAGMLPKGHFNLGGRLPRTRKNVSLVKGWFDTSFPEWNSRAALSEPPLLIHVDCDTYASTCDVLRLCSPYVNQGIILHFDDYFGFPNWRNSGYKALMEFVEANYWQLKYISYGTKEVAVFISRPH